MSIAWMSNHSNPVPGKHPTRSSTRSPPPSAPKTSPGRVWSLGAAQRWSQRGLPDGGHWTRAMCVGDRCEKLTGTVLDHYTGGTLSMSRLLWIALSLLLMFSPPSDAVDDTAKAFNDRALCEAALRGDLA